MRLAASLHSFLTSLLLLFSRRMPLFAAVRCALLEAQQTAPRLDKSPQRIIIGLIEAVIFPARYFFGEYAIGPP